MVHNGNIVHYTTSWKFSDTEHYSLHGTGQCQQLQRGPSRIREEGLNLSFAEQELFLLCLPLTCGVGAHIKLITYLGGNAQSPLFLDVRDRG